MNRWRTLIVAVSAAAALAVGLGLEAHPGAGGSLHALLHMAAPAPAAAGL